MTIKTTDIRQWDIEDLTGKTGNLRVSATKGEGITLSNIHTRESFRIPQHMTYDVATALNNAAIYADLDVDVD